MVYGELRREEPGHYGPEKIMNIKTNTRMLALLYDWHNTMCLRGQQVDVAYWLRTLEPGAEVAVMGAGTGRVAVPIAESGRSVLALDRDACRLERIPRTPNLTTCEADFMNLPEYGRFDHVLFPYNAVLLVDPGTFAELFRACVRALKPGGRVFLDLSARFARRGSHARRLIAQGFCTELGCDVKEFQTVWRRSDSLEIRAEFEIGGSDTIVCTEQWYWAHHRRVREVTQAAGLRVSGIVRGYGEWLEHKRVYCLAIDNSAPIGADPLSSQR